MRIPFNKLGEFIKYLFGKKELNEKEIDLFTNLLKKIKTAQDDYKAGKPEDQEKIREEIGELELEIQKLRPDYKVDWAVLSAKKQKSAEQTWHSELGKSKMLREWSTASRVSKTLEEMALNLPKHREEIEAIKKDLLEVSKISEGIKTSVAGYKKDLGRYRRNSLLMIGGAFVLSVAALSLYFYILGTNIMKKADTAQTRTTEYIEVVQEYEDTATAQIREARKSLDEKIAEVTAPALKRINDVYAMSELLDERVACIETNYSILENMRKDIQGLQQEAAADREKYAPILPKLNAIEANLAKVIKNKVDAEEYKKEMEDFKESISTLRGDMNQLRNKNYGP